MQDGPCLQPPLLTKEITYEEKEIELTIQQARRELLANNFLPVNANSFNPLIDAYWLSFTVYNPNNFNQEVVLDFNNWSYVKLVEFNDSSQLIHHTGHLYPYQKRDFPIANKNYVRLFVQQGDSTEVLVRLQKAYNNEKIRTAVISLLGSKIIDEQGKLNFKAIAEMVFTDDQLLLSLNKIIHPFVQNTFEKWCENQNSKVSNTPKYVCF